MDAVAFTLPDTAHPALLEGLAWWRGLCPANQLPGRQHIDPVRIPGLLPHLWLLDVLRDAGQPMQFRLRYRLVGSHVDLGFGQPKTGRWFDEVEPAFAKDPMMRAPYEAAIFRHEPSYRKGKPRFAFNSGAAALERLLLPLASDGHAVDMLLGFTVFYDSAGTLIRPAL